MLVPKVEKLMGIDVYATTSPGIGGTIRQTVEDFVVEEVLVDGSKASVDKPACGQCFGLTTAKGRYLLCILVKRNWDTFHAIKTIADQLGVDVGQIHIAGIKDARAITAQHMTVEGVSTEAVRNVKVKDIEIFPVSYFRSKLSSYYLLGNSFHVTIRGIRHPKSTIRKRITKTIEELESIGGVPNFFGHQRFGTTRPITHLVGKALVKGNFKKAALIFLTKSSLFEHLSSMQARRELRLSQDYKQALKMFPKQLRYERLMLKHLARKPNDFLGAFRKLPEKLRELFPQAYQAYLFNKFLSKRIENGLSLNRVEIGDYVVNVERSGLPLLTMHKIASLQTINEINDAIKAGKMRLAVPLVGFKQPTSQGLQGKIEEEILKEEDITPKNFKIKEMPEIAAKGELRTALAPLKNFFISEVSEDTANPPKNMVKVSFMLFRGSYATIVLRELMKTRNPIKAGF